MQAGIFPTVPWKAKYQKTSHGELTVAGHSASRKSQHSFSVYGNRKMDVSYSWRSASTASVVDTVCRTTSTGGERPNVFGQSERSFLHLAAKYKHIWTDFCLQLWSVDIRWLHVAALCHD